MQLCPSGTSAPHAATLCPQTGTARTRDSKKKKSLPSGSRDSFEAPESLDGAAPFQNSRALPQPTGKQQRPTFNTWLRCGGQTPLHRGRSAAGCCNRQPPAAGSLPCGSPPQGGPVPMLPPLPGHTPIRSFQQECSVVTTGMLHASIAAFGISEHKLLNLYD